MVPISTTKHTMTFLEFQNFDNLGSVQFENLQGTKINKKHIFLGPQQLASPNVQQTEFCDGGILIFFKSANPKTLVNPTKANIFSNGILFLFSL